METGLPTGCYRYTLTGTDALGNAASVSSVVKVDTAAPSQTVTVSTASGAAVLSGSRVFYRGSSAGSGSRLKSPR